MIPTNPQQIIAQNPQAFLRVLATNFPHPAIQRLLDMSVGSPRPTQRQGPPSMTGAIGNAVGAAVDTATGIAKQFGQEVAGSPPPETQGTSPWDRPSERAEKIAQKGPGSGGPTPEVGMGAP